MARIPQHFIDQLLERTDIVALVDARVSLKKSGREYAACCPFHDEKTPSFTVSPAKQFYHCFGCGAHGTAISFLMEYDRLAFRDAVEVLAAAAGMEVPEQAAAANTQTPNREPLLEAMRLAERRYQSNLRQSQAAIAYLKNRGVTGAMAKHYGLGFAADSWNDLTQRLPDRSAAARAGLLVERDSGGYFDRFRNRLMFPIRDTRGRAIAFGGRTLGNDSAKYLNSPETPLFHKSDQMYGLYEARQAQRHIERLLAVEGYMDVIALAQHDFSNAVATLGTATTAAHLTTLFRHTDEVVFCFDGDEAGVRAARKALERSLGVLRGTRRVRFLFLPEGEDPDSLVRSANGRAEMTQAIAQARPASAVLLNQLTEGLDLTTPDGRAQLVERARQPLAALPPEAFRAEMIAEIGRLSGLPATDLRGLFASNRRGPHRADHARATATSASRGNKARNTRLPPATRGLMLLLAEPRLAVHIESTEGLHNHPNPGTRIMAEAIDFFASNPTLSVAQWLEHHRQDQYFNRLQELATAEVPGDESQRAAEFIEVIAHLQQASRWQELRRHYDALVARQEEGPLEEADVKELKEVWSQLQKQAPPGS
jgi:DNA primase